MYRILHIPSSSFLTYHKEPIGKTGKTLRRITIGNYSRKSTVYEFRFRWFAERQLKRVFEGRFFLGMEVPCDEILHMTDRNFNEFEIVEV